LYRQQIQAGAKPGKERGKVTVTAFRPAALKLGVAAILALVIAVGAAAVDYWRSSGNSDHDASWTPATAKGVEPFITRAPNGSITLLPSIGDGSAAGLTSDQLSELRRGLDAYNRGSFAGERRLAADQGAAGRPFFGFMASSAEAWNSQWVSCQWWGCIFALSHTTTQNLITVINATPWFDLARTATVWCATRFPSLSWNMCPILGAEIAIGGKVLAWQLSQQDRGGGVYIYATYWKQWPGITSQ